MVDEKTKRKGKKQSQTFQKHICTSNYMVSVEKQTQRKSCHNEITIIHSKYFFSLILLFTQRKRELFSFFSVHCHRPTSVAYFKSKVIQLFYNKNPFISLHFIIQFSLAIFSTSPRHPFFFHSHTHEICLVRTQNKTQPTKEEKKRNTRRKTHFVFAEILSRERTKGI